MKRNEKKCTTKNIMDCNLKVAMVGRCLKN